jgi:hypothetical protein
VALDDLLTIAVLTSAQATYIAVELLEAAAPTDAAGDVHAVVRADGEVVVADRTSGPTGVSMVDLLDSLVHSARRLPAHPQPYQLWLLHHLEAQVGEIGHHPAERASVLRDALAEVLGPEGIPRIRGELAALVEAYGAVAVSRPATSAQVNGATPTMTVTPPMRALWTHPSRPNRRDLGRRRRRRSRRVLILLVVLAVAVAAAGYLFLRGPGSGAVDSVFGDNHAAGTPGHHPPASHQQHRTGHAAGRHHKTVPALADRSSGQIRSVVLHKNRACAPGVACPVTVTVHLAPSTTNQIVGWRVGAIRGCTRKVAWSPETTVTAKSGWTRVFANSSVQVPKGRFHTLVALTSSPSHAQSRPIPVAGDSLRC